MFLGLRRTIVVLGVLFGFLLIAAPAVAGGDPEETPNEEESSQDGSGTAQGGADLDPETYIASVNGVGIERATLNQTLNQVQTQYMMQGRQMTPTDQENLRGQVLDQLIAEELLYQIGVDEGIEPEQDVVDQEIERIQGQFDSEDAYQQALEANNTSEEQLRENIARSQIVQQALDQFVEEPEAVSDADVQSFYDENPDLFAQGEQITASHILISTQELTEEEAIQDARERAEAIRQELLNGADFAQTAREESEGPSGENGGSLGTFGRGQMVPAFEEAAFSLEPGEISEIVETQFGFHIIRVSEKTESSTVPLAEVSSQIVEFLSQQRRNEAVNEYVEGLREAADVTVFGEES